MKLKCIETGSSGNCYLLNSSSGETLILDCGIPIKDIKKGLNWDISHVAGCIVTHRHGDHAKSAKDISSMGIFVWQPYVDEKKIQKMQIGCFDVQCFDVPHDGTPNRGFIIDCDGQKLLYMTDYEYCPYNFRKQRINHMLIECNYIKEMVDHNIPNFDHKLKGHAELKTVQEFVAVNATDDLQNVILCHLGHDSSDKYKIIAEIRICAQASNVDVAEPEKEWLLRKMDECPF